MRIHAATVLALVFLSSSKNWANHDGIRCSDVSLRPAKIHLVGFRAYSPFQGQLEIGDPFVSLKTRIISDQVGGFLFSRADTEAYESYFAFPFDGQMAAHQGYGDGAPTEELRVTKEVDSESMDTFSYSGRLGYAHISVSSENKIRKAYLRVINGTGSGLERPRNEILPDYYLPAERLLFRKGIRTEFFNEYRKKGFQIIELGKYFIDEALSAEEYKAVRKELWKWFYRNYLDDKVVNSDKVLFVFDVFNEKRKDSTIKYFGAEVLPPHIFQPSLEPPNFILVSDLAAMRKFVQRIIKSP